MVKYLKFSEIAYIALILFSIYMSYKRWDVDRNNAYIFLLFSVFLVFMYFFKRRFRIRYEKRRKDERKK